MEIIVLQVFVSLMLVVGSIVLLGYSAKQRDHEHHGRLALLPLENDVMRKPTGNQAEGEAQRARTENV